MEPLSYMRMRCSPHRLQKSSAGMLRHFLGKMLQALELKANTVKISSLFLAIEPCFHCLERNPKNPLEWQK